MAGAAGFEQAYLYSLWLLERYFTRYTLFSLLVFSLPIRIFPEALREPPGQLPIVLYAHKMFGRG